MRILLFGLGVVAGLLGIAVLTESQSAFHEMEGLLLFTIAAILVTGAAIVEAQNQVKDKLEMISDQLDDAADTVEETTKPTKQQEGNHVC